MNISQPLVRPAPGCSVLCREKGPSGRCRPYIWLLHKGAGAGYLLGEWAVPEDVRKISFDLLPSAIGDPVGQRGSPVVGVLFQPPELMLVLLALQTLRGWWALQLPSKGDLSF